jgi:hypothetical protein
MRQGEKCDYCKLTATELGPNLKECYDPCLGKLPGVKFACCGHGAREGYMYFENEVIVRFNISSSNERVWNKTRSRFRNKWRLCPSAEC